MTNKINGIDVSECCFYNNGKCDNPNGMACNCANNAVCYFKQLKRLQEENEKLKNKNNDLIEEIASGNIDIAILQKENEKLKEDLKGETEQAQKWYQLETDKHFLALKFCKALEEIRNEIGDLKDINKLINLQKILDKINEVLNENN